MKLTIVKTFVLSYKKLFVLVIDHHEFEELAGNKRIFHDELKVNMLIHSFEMVSLSNGKSATGITINYQSQNQLDLLESLKVGDHIYVK